MPPELIRSAVLNKLAHALSETPAFTFSLSRVERFSATAYLAPDPSEPFVRLTDSVVRSYPAYPPFRGLHSSIIPHLTVANGDPDKADIAAEELLEIMALHGPIVSVCRTVDILENSAGTWRPMTSIDLPQNMASSRTNRDR